MKEEIKSPATTVVCAVLSDGENQILAVRRPLGKRLEGLWEFPGGKVESDEENESAVQRELREELDIDLALLGSCNPLSPVVHVYEFGKICLIPFFIRCSNRPHIRLLEHIEHRWVSIEEAAGLDWAPADVPILEELKQFLKPR